MHMSFFNIGFGDQSLDPHAAANTLDTLGHLPSLSRHFMVSLPTLAEPYTPVHGLNFELFRGWLCSPCVCLISGTCSFKQQHGTALE